MERGWLHPQCWDKWYLDRRTRAQEALEALGLAAPETAALERKKIGNASQFPNDVGKNGDA